jgi:hypothetical protein
MEQLALKSEIEGTRLGVDIERSVTEQQLRKDLEGARIKAQMQSQKPQTPPEQGE